MHKLIFGLIYYCSITPTCFGPLVEAIAVECLAFHSNHIAT